MTILSADPQAREHARTVTHVGGDPATARRLATLGVRPGANIQLLHRAAGGGSIVAVAGARLALDRRVLSLIEVADA